METNKSIDLSILNLTLTLRCTLKCKLCVADVTKYSPAPHFEADELCETIDRCFRVVNTARRFQFSGGEPLIHRDIVRLLKKGMEYADRFGFLGIFSNGTVLPDLELLETMKSYHTPEKFKFYISDYGAISPKASEIAALLDSFGIPYEVKKYHGEQQHMDGWVDYGAYRHFDYTEQELEQLCSACGVNQMGGVWAVRFGEIHRCTRSASGMSLQKIPRVEDDYINLFDDSLSVEAQRQKLRALMGKKYITACHYCTGDFGTDDRQKRHPAAEQL